ncbi:MAG: hypothetical protein AAGA53_01655 [Pseudomonadota bacterium]
MRTIFAVIITLFMTQFALASTLSTEQKVQLQAAMYQHIEANLNDGAITHVNLTTGEIIELVPTKAHALILTFEQNFVLCADFLDPQGKTIDVDFYIKPHNDTYVVFRMEIDNRKPLKKLMSEGRISRLQ